MTIDLLILYTSNIDFIGGANIDMEIDDYWFVLSIELWR